MGNSNETKQRFDDTLKVFVLSIKDAMKAAKECSIMALEHYAEHDNLNWCQKFLDAMPKNFTRKAAYVKWLAAHSPITMVDGKFKKDKADDAVKFDLEGARKKVFWDYAPANEDILLTDAQAFAKLMTAIKYFRRDSVKTTETVKALVNEVEKLVDTAVLQSEQGGNGDETPGITTPDNDDNDDENAEIEATA